MAATKLSKTEYREKANKLRTKGLSYAQIKDQLGIPIFDGVEYKAESDGKGGTKFVSREGRRLRRDSANKTRSNKDQTSTEEARSNRARLQSQIKAERTSTLVRYGTNNDGPILEHNLALKDPMHKGSMPHAPGDDVSKSEPGFKLHKDNLEKALKGTRYSVVLDEISGETRVVDRKTYNPYGYNSRQGVEVPVGSDIKKFVDNLGRKNENGNGHSGVNGTNNGNAANALRIARNLAVGPLSIGAGVLATGAQAKATMSKPTASNFEDLAWDGANLVADLVGLIPTPLTVGISEAAQKTLGIGHMARQAARGRLKPPQAR